MLNKKQMNNFKDFIYGVKVTFVFILLILFVFISWFLLKMFMESLTIFIDVLKAGIVNLTPEMALIVTTITLYVSFKLLVAVIDIIMAILKYFKNDL